MGWRIGVRCVREGIFKAPIEEHRNLGRSTKLANDPCIL